MYVRECDLSVNEVLFGNVMVCARTHLPTTEGSTDQIISFVMYMEFVSVI